MATFLYANDHSDQLPFAWWHYAPNDDPYSNNSQTLIIPYLFRSQFMDGTTTSTSDFARNVFACPARLTENLWGEFPVWPGCPLLQPKKFTWGGFGRPRERTLKKP